MGRWMLEIRMARKTKAQLAAPSTFTKLTETYPDAHCELDHASPFQLVVATVLSEIGRAHV